MKLVNKLFLSALLIEFMLSFVFLAFTSTQNRQNFDWSMYCLISAMVTAILWALVVVWFDK